MVVKRRRLVIGLGIAGLSLLVGAVVAAYFLYTDEALPLSVIAWPATGFLLGVALAYLPATARTLSVEDELETLPALLADDLDALFSRRIQSTHVYALVTLLAAGWLGWLVFHYQKWHASWGAWNVLVVALAVAAGIAYYGIRCDWFQRRHARFPHWVFLLPACGFVICAALGMRYAEPQEWGGLSRLERSQLTASDTYWLTTRGSRVVSFADDATSGASEVGAIDFDCDDDACGYLLLAVVLIVIVAIAIGGSVVIPHFWVVATATLLTIMALVAVRELLYVPKARLSLEP